MRKVSKSLTILALIILTCIPALYIAEADPTINLSLHKDYGYGMGQDMAGLWTLNAETSSDILQVQFYFDDQLQQTDNTAPFSWQFNTANYTIGTHTLKAIAHNAAAESQTETLTRNFVEDTTNSILIIIIIIAVVIVALSVVVALYRIKKNKR
jgi:hypothetical protein